MLLWLLGVLSRIPLNCRMWRLWGRRDLFGCPHLARCMSQDVLLLWSAASLGSMKGVVGELLLCCTGMMIQHLLCR